VGSFAEEALIVELASLGPAIVLDRPEQKRLRA
jgi:hypothetical protein